MRKRNREKDLPASWEGLSDTARKNAVTAVGRYIAIAKSGPTNIIIHQKSLLTVQRLTDYVHERCPGHVATVLEDGAVQLKERYAQ